MFGFIPPEVAAYMQMMQAAFEADEANTQIIKLAVKRARCFGCGQFMSLDDTHLNVMPMGYSHMVESCLTNVVIKIRASMASWDWNKYEQINPKPDVIMSAREDSDEVQEPQGSTDLGSGSV